MALSQLTETILQQAGREAEAILEAARKEADAYWEKESARLREAHERRLEADRRELETRLEREITAKQVQHRLEVLRVKNEIIEEVFRRALEGIISLPQDGYARWLCRQIELLPDVTGATLLANERDRPLVARIVRETGRSFRIGEEDVHIRGGFVLRAGQFDLDCSIEALMGDLEETLAREVAAGLFGEEEHGKA